MKITIEQTVLICILILTILVSFSPHFSYPFPLHVDEWFHIAVGKEIAANGFAWPTHDVFTSAPKFGSQEVIWHYSLAIFVFLFNPSIFAWQFLPPLMAVLAVLSVYFFARRWGERTALIAAFLVALLPSNVTIGGLSFLVPVNLSLIVIPLALHFAFDTDLNAKKNLAALFGLSLFLLLAHPPSAVVLLLALLFYSLLLFKENRKKMFFIWTAALLALLVSLPNYLPALAAKGIESVQFPFWYFLEEIPLVYGIIPTIFFAAGFYLFLKKGKKEEFAIIAISVFLIVDIVFFSNTGLGLIVPYQRAFLPLMLFMSLVAANALARIKDNRLFLPVLGAILVLAVFQQVSTPYYHVIEYQDYEAFVWIKDNTPKDAIVLTDTWRARALTPIAERRVYTVLPFGPVPGQLEKNALAEKFFADKCVDSAFLKENGIGVLYSQVKCENLDLEDVGKGIYLVRQPN